MRMLLTVQIDTKKGNQLIKEGRMESTIQGLMAKLQPEAAYFHLKDGRRAMTIVCSMDEDAAIPTLVDPFWQEFEAIVDIVPCMNAQELDTGIERLG